jgi:hypothetical protein
MPRPLALAAGRERESGMSTGSHVGVWGGRAAAGTDTGGDEMLDCGPSHLRVTHAVGRSTPGLHGHCGGNGPAGERVRRQ